MTLKDYLGPKKDWNNEKWLKHAHIMVHSPWIDDAEREYWRDKIKELTK
tara:strand:- start:289 stop:435 length:147 start_codon:yes stop_codon:yes gene_type:complete